MPADQEPDDKLTAIKRFYQNTIGVSDVMAKILAEGDARRGIGVHDFANLSDVDYGNGKIVPKTSTARPALQRQATKVITTRKARPRYTSDE